MMWGEALWGPKERGWDDKVFAIIWGETRLGQNKIMRGGNEDPILWPRPAPLPSLNNISNITKLTIFA